MSDLFFCVVVICATTAFCFTAWLRAKTATGSAIDARVKKLEEEVQKHHNALALRTDGVRRTA